jgi:hypothetical protein
LLPPDPAAPRAVAAAGTAGGRWRPAHFAGLTALVVVQPSLDLLARHPSFLGAHQADAGLVWALVAVFCLGLPTLAAVCGFGLRGWPRLAALAVLGLCWLGGQQLSQAVLGTLELPQNFAGPVAGLLLFAALSRFAGLRSVLALLAWSPAVMAALFLAEPQVRPFWIPAPAEAASAPWPAETSIAILLVDELSLTSLLATEDTVDADAFPHFAALAATSTFFHDTSAVGTFTHVALPSLLRGRFQREREGTGQNLFEALGAGAQFDVLEQISALCPPTLCAPAAERGSFGARLGRLLEDWSAIYLHAALPPTVRGGLPSLAGVWRDFWRQGSGTDGDDRYLQALRFLRDLPPSVPGRPRLIFQHVLLPHHPFEHLADGSRYRFGGSFTIGASGVGHGIEWERNQLYQLHLLQTQATDAVLGQFRRRLEELGLWERSWVVVTADHGLSLRLGRPLRGAEDAEALRGEVLRVPLFVKRPGQTASAIDRRPIEHIDVLPTLFAWMGRSWPWPAEGRVLPADGSAVAPPAPRLMQERGIPPERWAAAAGAFSEALAWKNALPGLRVPRPGYFFAISPRPDLFGRPLPAAEPSGLKGYLWSTTPWIEGSTGAAAHDSFLIGELAWGAARPPAAGSVVAIATGGSVVAVAAVRRANLMAPVRAWRARVGRPGQGGELYFSALIDPALLRPGRNPLELVLVEPGDPAPRRITPEALIVEQE